MTSSRFWCVDPITEEYYDLTPYQFASNNPSSKIEIEGLEGVRITLISNYFVTKVNEAKNEYDARKAVGFAFLSLAAPKPKVESQYVENMYGKENYSGKISFDEKGKNGLTIFDSKGNELVNYSTELMAMMSNINRIENNIKEIEKETEVTKKETEAIIKQNNQLKQINDYLSLGVDILTDLVPYTSIPKGVYSLSTGENPVKYITGQNPKEDNLETTLTAIGLPVELVNTLKNIPYIKTIGYSIQTLSTLYKVYQFNTQKDEKKEEKDKK